MTQRIGPHELHCGDAITVLRQMPERYVSLTVTSPPYEDARTYGVGFRLKGQDWVDWLIPIIVECCRVTDGLVLVNAAGKVNDFQYTPVMEWLVTDLTRQHGIVCGPAPYVYRRVGIPGSGGQHYHRRDWEPVYAFALPDRLPLRWSDNTATGHAIPARIAAVSPRGTNGARNHGFYSSPDIANAGNVINETYTAAQVQTILDGGDVIDCKVGGGLMGHPLASENEAPMSLTLATWLVRSYAPPGGRVLDPFMGSGTTLHACMDTGRIGVGIDLRESQIELTRRRLQSVTPTMFDEA